MDLSIPRSVSPSSLAEPFRHRDFRWLWGGSLLSYAAQWIQIASMGWVTYEITGSGTMVGAVVALRGLPIALLAPFAGMAADRYDRRKVLEYSQWFSAAISFAFGAALALGAVTTWMLFLFSLLMGVSMVLDRPARQSSMFDLVPRAAAMRAVALNVMGNNLSRVLGPIAGGFLIAWIGMAGNFAVQGALCALAAFLVLKVDFHRHAEPRHILSASRELAAGMRFAARDPTIRALFLMGTSSFLILVPAMGTLFPMYAKEVYGAGPEAVGMLYTAVGAGGVAGGYLASTLSRIDRQGLVQIFANLVFVLMVLGLAVSPTLAGGVVFSALAGAAEMVMSTSNMATLQMAAPENMGGRINSLTQFYPAMISAGALITGPLADLYGPGGSTLIAAILCAVATLALYFGSWRLRTLRVSEL